MQTNALSFFVCEQDRLLSSVRKRNTQWMELKRTTLRSLPSSKWQCNQLYSLEYSDMCHPHINHSQHFFFYSDPRNSFWIFVMDDCSWSKSIIMIFMILFKYCYQRVFFVWHVQLCCVTCSVWMENNKYWQLAYVVCKSFL